MFPLAFTDMVRHSLTRAREQAEALGHDRVDTEHLLCALLRPPRNEAQKALEDAGVSLEELTAASEEAASKRSQAPSPPSLQELSYSSGARRVLESALVAAARAGRDAVGTFELLTGLCEETQGTAAAVLASQGVSERVLHDPRDRARAKPASHPKPVTFSIDIDDGADRSIYEQIADRVREAVATGELAPGDRLPSVRRLADSLDIAPGTVARTYAELERLGVVTTAGARGTRVAEPRPQASSQDDRIETLTGLLRPVAVACFHLGADAADLRNALERAIQGIFD